MLYLGTSPTDPAVATLLNNRTIGLMCQPKSNLPKPGWLWAADNGCFSAEEWKWEKWHDWLWRFPSRSGCLFATVPDVVADHDATMDRFRKFHQDVVEACYPVAFVAQDGAEPHTIPWDQIDCLFVGGSTTWKISGTAFAIAAEARSRGKWVHVGRINSGRRYMAWVDYADSTDGTFLRYAPVENAGRLQRWLEDAQSNLSLWSDNEFAAES